MSFLSLPRAAVANASAAIDSEQLLCLDRACVVRVKQAAKNTEHTLNTLRYADRLKEIGGGRTAAARGATVGGGSGGGGGARRPRGSGR